MKTTTSKSMTAEEFYEWANRPENAGKHYELERGEVVEVGRPGELHGVVCVNVGYLLSAYVRQRRKGYVCGNDTGIIWDRAPDIVRGPDLFFYNENRSFADFNPKYSEQVPHLVVEVLSPTDRMNKVTRRIAQFLRWGVRIVWLIDPEDRTVAIYGPDRETEVLDADQELIGGDALPDFRCQMAEFFFATGDVPPS